MEVRKGQIRAQILRKIPASRRMKRGRPYIGIARLLAHDGLEEEMALVYYEEDPLGIVDERTVRLIRFSRAEALAVAALLEEAAREMRRWALEGGQTTLLEEVSA